MSYEFRYLRIQPDDDTETDLEDLIGLFLSYRRALWSAGIRTVEELLGTTEEELLAIPKFRKKGIEEAKYALSRYFAKTGAYQPFPRPESEIDPLREEVEVLFTDSLEQPLSSLELSEELLADLTKAGVKTINQLLVLTEDEIKSVSKTVSGQYQGLVSEVRLYLIKKGKRRIFPAHPFGTPAETVLEQISPDLTAGEE